jgi:hypothetical protein
MGATNIMAKPTNAELQHAITDVRGSIAHLEARVDALSESLNARFDAMAMRIDTLVDAIADLRVELAQHRHDD